MPPRDTITAQLRPMTASQKYSKLEKFRANRARKGAAASRVAKPKSPPKAAAHMLMPIANPALPFSVSP